MDALERLNKKYPFGFRLTTEDMDWLYKYLDEFEYKSVKEIDEKIWKYIDETRWDWAILFRIDASESECYAREYADYKNLIFNP